MASPRPATPALLVIAAFSRHEEALRWGRERLQDCFGPIGLVGEPYVFNQTNYYEKAMGTQLRKQLLAFERLVDPGTLADLKLRTNALERELLSERDFPEARPLNLDPGLLQLGKFCLATVKDQAHRIYLRDGIFAEVTLQYREGRFHPWEWTYADYRLPCVHAFLEQARTYYRHQLLLRGGIGPCGTLEDSCRGTRLQMEGHVEIRDEEEPNTPCHEGFQGPPQGQPCPLEDTPSQGESP